MSGPVTPRARLELRYWSGAASSARFVLKCGLFAACAAAASVSAILMPVYRYAQWLPGIDAFTILLFILFLSILYSPSVFPFGRVEIILDEAFLTVRGIDCMVIDDGGPGTLRVHEHGLNLTNNKRFSMPLVELRRWCISDKEPLIQFDFHHLFPIPGLRAGAVCTWYQMSLRGLDKRSVERLRAELMRVHPTVLCSLETNRGSSP
jgi:hypothetical protein